MAASGTLYLIPVPLGAMEAAAVLGTTALNALPAIDMFVVENAKSARRFLKQARYPHPLQSVDFATLDEHTSPHEIDTLLAPLKNGRDCGLISEAGCPAVADPGALLVRRAHAEGIRVVPFPGPSALLLALMASGMNGQRFAFHGYLPVAAEPRRRKLLALERASRADGATHIFIETPYRNMQLWEAVTQTCRADTLLSIAADLTLPGEWIRTQPIAAWRKAPPDLARRPAVFLIHALPDT